METGRSRSRKIVAVHKRIFDKVDANKDGKVTIEEIQTFFRE